MSEDNDKTSDEDKNNEVTRVQDLPTEPMQIIHSFLPSQDGNNLAKAFASPYPAKTDEMKRVREKIKALTYEDYLALEENHQTIDEKNILSYISHVTKRVDYLFDKFYNRILKLEDTNPIEKELDKMLGEFTFAKKLMVKRSFNDSADPMILVLRNNNVSPSLQQELIDTAGFVNKTEVVFAELDRLLSSKSYNNEQKAIVRNHLNAAYTFLVSKSIANDDSAIKSKVENTAEELFTQYVTCEKVLNKNDLSNARYMLMTREDFEKKDFYDSQRGHYDSHKVAEDSKIYIMCDAGIVSGYELMPLMRLGGARSLGTVNFCPVLQEGSTVIEYKFLGLGGIVPNAYSFDSVDLSGMGDATEIGDDFLNHFSFGIRHEDDPFIELNLDPLKKVSKIGKGFFSHNKIKELDLTPLQNVTDIGEHFLCSSDEIEYLDLTALRNIKQIPKSFISHCHKLKEADLSPLTGVTEIGSYLLYSNYGLEQVNFSGMKNVSKVESERFLGDCGKLREIVYDNDTSKVLREAIFAYCEDKPHIKLNNKSEQQQDFEAGTPRPNPSP